MKNLLRGITVILLAGLGLAGILQARAQQNVIGYLQSRFQHLQLPVINSRITQDFPLQLEVTIRTTGRRGKGTPDDVINSHLVMREVILARQQGYFVDKFTEVFIDPTGKEAGRSSTGIGPAEYLWLNRSPSRISNEETARLIQQEMELHGLTLVQLHVASTEGLQSASLTMFAASVDAANRAIPEFMPSFRMLIDDINAKGAHVVSYRIQLADGTGTLLMDSIRDLQIKAESTWLADDILDWYPAPPPAGYEPQP